MIKKDLVSRIAYKTGRPQDEVGNFVEVFMNEVKSELIAGSEVTLRGFGTFYPKRRAEKIARDIRKGISIVVPEHHIPAFKPASEFKMQVK